jgi:hypothetical protein
MTSKPLTAINPHQDRVNAVRRTIGRSVKAALATHRNDVAGFALVV